MGQANVRVRVAPEAKTAAARVDYTTLAQLARLEAGAMDGSGG